MGLCEEWRGRVYLFDAANTENLERSLHFLEAVTEHITPALTNVFLLRRLRSRAGAVERARVARELHDGAIRRSSASRCESTRCAAAAKFSPGMDVGRSSPKYKSCCEARFWKLRELMQALRPIDLETSDQLPDVLASLVERFRRDTGVSARFVFDGGPVPLPAPTALELARIVQEALVNVRKHSRARNVLVRLTEHGSERARWSSKTTARGSISRGDCRIASWRSGALDRPSSKNGRASPCAARGRFRAGDRRTSRADARSRGSCLISRATCGSPLQTITRFFATV
jgi:hypothetical protein